LLSWNAHYKYRHFSINIELNFALSGPLGATRKVRWCSSCILLCHAHFSFSGGAIDTFHKKISRQQIEQDINKYEQRLLKLRQRLKSLLVTGTWKLKVKLQREIRPVEDLIGLAQEALKDKR
jgi:hypothetical protein